MPSRIEDYALIGDLNTAALVGRDGSIDWLCWPHFDSDACFAALLGEPKNGRARIAPRDKTARVTRRYRGDTLILETRFETADGVATLIDFMPPRSGEDSHLVRIVVGERGRVEFESELVLRFGYGAHVPWVTRLQDGTRRAIAGPDMVIMRTRTSIRRRWSIRKNALLGPRASGRTGPARARFPVRGTRRCAARSSRSRR